MDLSHGSTFRVLLKKQVSDDLPPGLYRCVICTQQIGKTAVVLIQPDEPNSIPLATGRRKKPPEQLKNPRKKCRERLIGKLIWIDLSDLTQLEQDKSLTLLKIERRTVPTPSEATKEAFEKRKAVMRDFLDYELLSSAIAATGGIGTLVRAAMAEHHVSRSFVYTQWSNLCRWGFDAKSLMPNRDRCGGPNLPRRCDPATKSAKARKKAGKKTRAQNNAKAYGITLDPSQPGMSTEWASAIRAGDEAIPAPKPRARVRCDRILLSHFSAKAKEENGKIKLLLGEAGTYPNDRQIMRVLNAGKTRLQRLLEKTTKAHFQSSLRGLLARNWQGVSGPGHTWAIDSTVGDIYLRSSIDRSWIVGRPIVYVIVDVWSTAVVGFYVCLCGPSWDTAKVALFNSAADPTLVGSMWGYQPMFTLNPAPCLCYALMCDRGEYISQGHRSTALKVLPLTSYAPPYRGDLKGLAEVLHRIEKDAQFLFIPGAMDYRREELDLRKVNPDDCILTVREYVIYLYELFSEYNLTANREHRVDPQMRAAGVYPSPAGLWRWGHEVGIGFRRDILESDLITTLLPSGKARVRRDTVRYRGGDYMADAVRAEQWTAIARNFGGWEIDVNCYPGSTNQIWTPHGGSTGLIKLTLVDECAVSADLTWEELADTQALGVIQRMDEEHQRKLHSLGALERINMLLAQAKLQTGEAIAKATAKAPPMTEARAMELAVTHRPDASVEKMTATLKDESARNYEEMMAAIGASANRDQ